MTAILKLDQKHSWKTTLERVHQISVSPPELQTTIHIIGVLYADEIDGQVLPPHRTPSYIACENRRTIPHNLYIIPEWSLVNDSENWYT